MSLDYGTWEDLYTYLEQAKCLTEGTERDLVEVVNSLRDGISLCKLANALAGAPIPFNDPAPIQFLCLENINIFLNFCSENGLPDDALFEPDDLFHASKFGTVVKTVSILSKTSMSTDKGFSPFPAPTRGQPKVLLSEDVYENLSGIIEHMQPSKIYGATGLYGGLYATRRRQNSASTNKQMIFDASDLATDDIYTSVVRGGRKSKPHVRVSDKKQHQFDELLGNEENFLNSLKVMNSAYRIPLEAFLATQQLSIDISSIFKFLDTIISLHTRLLAALKARLGITCEAFVQFRDELIIYADYCMLLPKAYETITMLEQHKQLGPALLRMKDQSKQSFHLKELINVPMQHVLRYTLLLKELVKASHESDETYGTLTKAYKVTQDIAKHVDEAKCDAENLQLMSKMEIPLSDFLVECRKSNPKATLSDFGRFMLDSDVKLRLLDSAKASSRYLFLFQRAIVVCKPRRCRPYAFYSQMNIKDFQISSQLVKGHKIPGIALISNVPQSSGFSCVFLFKTDGMRNEWMEQLQTAKAMTMMEELNPLPPNGHLLRPHNFDDGAVCSHCGLLLWGKFNQGVLCKTCGVSLHRECVKEFDPICKTLQPTSKAPAALKKTVRRARGDVSETTAKVGSMLVAVHNFQNHQEAQDGDLKFKRGDFVRVLAIRGKHWWYGEHMDTKMKGNFPISFFKLVQLKNEGRRLSMEPVKSKAPMMTKPLAVNTTSANAALSNSSEGIQRANTVSRPKQPLPYEQHSPAQPSSTTASTPATPQQTPPLTPTATTSADTGSLQLPTPAKSSSSSSLQSRGGKLRVSVTNRPAMPTPPELEARARSYSKPAQVLKLSSSTDGKEAPALPSRRVVREEGDALPPLPLAQKQHSTKWYIGVQSRLKAQEHLLLAGDGAFAVRESVKTPGDYVITVKFNGSIRHLKVHRCPQGYYLGTTFKFPNVPALVDYFQRHSLVAHFPDLDTCLLDCCGTKEFPQVYVYRALFPFDGEDDTELSFQKGQLIEVFEPDEAQEWWEGRMGSKIGFLPSNFVESMEASC